MNNRKCKVSKLHNDISKILKGERFYYIRWKLVLFRMILLITWKPVYYIAYVLIYFNMLHINYLWGLSTKDYKLWNKYSKIDTFGFLYKTK